MLKEYELIPLFREFVMANYKGKRLKANGHKLREGTSDNYANTLKLLLEFQTKVNFPLRLKTANKMGKTQAKAETNYWRRFYTGFSNFLYREKHCFDNYAGAVMKTVRSFLIYLARERHIQTGEFYRKLYVKREHIEILTLQPSQLRFLINDLGFHDSLPLHLKRTKDFFVFGCTVALRFSDLQNIKKRDITEVDGSWYLFVRSLKTDTISRIKLPPYAVDIVQKYSKRKSPGSLIFQTVCLRQFNKNIQSIGELAGWTQLTGKHRQRNGQRIEIFKNEQQRKSFRYCDLLSSHIMRRTAITTMLMAGVPEHVVRKISGHSANSQAFYRYINYSQSYLDKEIDKMHLILEQKDHKSV